MMTTTPLKGEGMERGGSGRFKRRKNEYRLVHDDVCGAKRGTWELFPGSGTGGRARSSEERLSGLAFAVSLLSLVLILTSMGGWGSPASAATNAAESEVRTSSLLDTSYIESTMESLAAADYGDYGMYFKLLETGEEAGYQADKAFTAASCYKVALVLYIYENAAAGRIDLESTIVYGSGDNAGGDGIIREMPVGTAFSVRTLCEYAIVYSDNIAAKMLKRAFGYHAFRDYARSLGCPTTGAYGLNLTTAREMGTILQRVLQFSGGDPLGREIVAFLRASIYKSRIPAGLPTGVDVGNKTGDYSGFLNDAAIVMLDDATYILCVLSSGAPGDSVHAAASRLIYEDVSSRICGGGHCTTGASGPATEWYFAEGTTREGFET
ncbi:MAG: serine hydrolase, partial [Actinobacteria bacterium]|nr:serine hydrolase [Actinomycetota bacterium]